MSSSSSSSSRNLSYIPVLHGSHRHGISITGAGFNFTKRGPISSAPLRRKACLCSPTTHPGSYRCSLHRALPFSSLNAQRSVRTNSMSRIGAAMSEWVRRDLTTPIVPSLKQKLRCKAFQSRPSRLSIMTKAKDL